MSFPPMRGVASRAAAQPHAMDEQPHNNYHGNNHIYTPTRPSRHHKSSPLSLFSLPPTLVEEDIICSICMGGEVAEGNEIVICEGAFPADDFILDDTIGQGHSALSPNRRASSPYSYPRPQSSRDAAPHAAAGDGQWYCNVAVHQLCYGITRIPHDEWYCRYVDAHILRILSAFSAHAARSRSAA